MARHKSHSLQDSLVPSLDISSLIDVCFLLLIYFLVATTLQKREVDVPAHFASIPKDAKPADLEPLRVNIHRDGSITSGIDGAGSILLDTNASARHLPMLEGFLRQYRESLGLAQVMVQIRVDEEVEQQRVMDVLNAMLGQEITQVSFIEG